MYCKYLHVGLSYTVSTLMVGRMVGGQSTLEPNAKVTRGRS